MARFARVVVPGIPYHITHRGNGRWLEPEPSHGDGPNLYHFAYNNPLMYVDFDGRAAAAVTVSRSAGDLSSNCVPRRPGATMPNGSLPPKDGSSCGPNCFGWADNNGAIRGPHEFQFPGGTGGTSVHGDRFPIPGEGSSVYWGGAGQGSHAGLMVGGCVANCHGNLVRYYSLFSSFPGATGPVTVGPIVYY